MLEINLIRHGKTFGNTKKRYIGRTDEDLLKSEIEKIKKIEMKEPDLVFSSPLKRCLETGRISFPNRKIIIIEKLQECDFGDFENKNYIELKDNKNYQDWIDSGGLLPFPGGEGVEEFKERINEGFLELISILEKENKKSATAFVHSGTIMSIMERYLPKERDYYGWNVENLSGYKLEIEKENKLYKIKKVSEI